MGRGGRIDLGCGIDVSCRGVGGFNREGCKAMHGRRGDSQKRRRHMWTDPPLGPTPVADPSLNFFFKVPIFVFYYYLLFIFFFYPSLMLFLFFSFLIIFVNVWNVLMSYGFLLILIRLNWLGCNELFSLLSFLRWVGCLPILGVLKL